MALDTFPIITGNPALQQHLLVGQWWHLEESMQTGCEYLQACMRPTGTRAAMCGNEDSKGGARRLVDTMTSIELKLREVPQGNAEDSYMIGRKTRERKEWPPLSDPSNGYGNLMPTRHEFPKDYAQNFGRL